MRALTLLLLTLLAGLFSLASQATELPLATPHKAKLCQLCHGKKGIAVLPIYPSLAGQPASVLADKLLAYTDGRDPDALMTAFAKTLSVTEREDIAAYYAQFPRPVPNPDKRAKVPDNRANKPPNKLAPHAKL
jgi:cytochrome c553